MHQQNIYYQIDGRNEGFNQNSKEIEKTLGQICRNKAREEWIECTKRIEGATLQYTNSNVGIMVGAYLMLGPLGIAGTAYVAIMAGVGTYYYNTEIRNCDVAKENMIDGGGCPS